MQRSIEVQLVFSYIFFNLVFLSLCSAEKEDGLLYQRRLEAHSNAAGPSLRNMMLRSNSVDRKLRCSYDEFF